MLVTRSQIWIRISSPWLLPTEMRCTAHSANCVTCATKQDRQFSTVMIQTNGRKFRTRPMRWREEEERNGGGALGRRGEPEVVFFLLRFVRSPICPFAHSLLLLPSLPHLRTITNGGF